MRILPAILCCCAWLTSQAQHDINFDADWTFKHRGVEKTVTLPHAWNEDDAFAVSIAELSTDTVRYRKHFRLPKSAKGKHVYIEFEGARQMAKVWLNGHYLGMHENGITAFGFDLTPYLDWRGENRLEVLTDNDWDYKEEATGTPFQWNNRNFNANYGGLPKHVRLHVLDDIHQTLPLYSTLGTTGVYIYGKNLDVAQRSGTVVAECEVQNEGRHARQVALFVTVTDRNGRRVAEFASESVAIAAGSITTLTAEQTLDNLHFWSWRYGYLYTVTTALRVNGKTVDEVTTRTGFRKTEFADGMIRLNDRVLMVHGYAQRTSNEWPAVGMSVPDWLSDYSNGLMVESGANLVRWMHTMPWRSDVQSCDRVGLLQAMPAGDAEKDVEGRQWEQRLEVMRDAIVYNRNSPSIVFYESGNKGISETHMQAMKAIRDEFDPHGGRAIGSREMLANNSCAEYGGEMLYINKSAGKPLWAMEYCRDEGLRRYWDDWTPPFHPNGQGPLYRGEPATAYNLNQDQLAIEHVRRWYDYWQVRPGTGRRVSSGGVKIIFSDTNTHYRGESNYRTSGVVDAMRLPKDSFYAHQVMWNGWVEPEQPQTYIIGHWNYPDGTVKPLYVVSNTDSVALLLNGQPLDVPLSRQYDFLFTADSIAFQPGQLQAIGYNNGLPVSNYTLETAGAPVRIRLTTLTSPQGFVADGSDMALITCEIVDSTGHRCPTDQRTVHFTIDGPAEWRGGIGQGERNCILQPYLTMECGINRALLRSLPTTTSTIRITATADGLPPTHLDIIYATTSERAATNPSLPTEEVFSRSLKKLKEALPIQYVTAGCNPETVTNAIDDDEETEWRNDGQTATAWITFTLKAPTRVDEISLKLSAWRRRSYPLQVIADDGSVLWNGSTPTSLGYVLLPLQPHAPTSTITIILLAAADEHEAFAQVTELAQPVSSQSDSDKSRQGEKVRHDLRIIECDLLKIKE